MEAKQQVPDRFQNLAMEMLSQPAQEMAVLRAIEHRARKDPTLDEYIEMCMKEQKDIEREEKKNAKELLS